jgi:hypothetical protein
MLAACNIANSWQELQTANVQALVQLMAANLTALINTNWPQILGPFCYPYLLQFLMLSFVTFCYCK